MAVVVGCVLTWLRCRGQFMFLDGIIHNRGLVVHPWREFREQGNSLFMFHIVLGLISFATMVIVLGIPLLIAWPDIAAWKFGSAAIMAIVVAIVLYIPVGIALGLVYACTHQFVVPLMWLRKQGVRAAWGEFRRVIVPGHVGSILLFLLMNLVLTIGGVVVSSIAGCVTCCIGFLPYLGTVLTLPVHVVLRSYGVFFLEQYGGEYRFFPENPAAPTGFPVIMPDGGQGQ